PEDPALLVRFAGYLTDDQAAALSAAGFATADALVHLRPETDAVAVGLSVSALERVRLQALSAAAGIPPAVAYALAAVDAWTSAEQLTMATPEEVLTAVRQAGALGLLDQAQAMAASEAEATFWLASLIQAMHAVGIRGGVDTATITAAPVETPCARTLP